MMRTSMRWALSVLAVLGLFGGPAATAGRLRTIGFETGGLGRNVFGVDSPFFEGYVPAGISSPTIDTTAVRSGNASLKSVGNGAAADYVYVDLAPNEAPAGSTWIYVRTYVRFDQFPTGTAGLQFMALLDSQQFPRCTWDLVPSGADWVLRCSAGGTLGNSGPLSLNQWYRLEFGFQAQTGACECRIDGSTIGSNSFGTPTTNSLSIVLLGVDGYYSGYSGTATLHFDDVAINSSNGSTQNSWPGAGQIVQLLPVGDHVRTGWTGGAGGSTNLYQAISNTPPIGSASTSETNSTQIKDSKKAATDNYDVSLATYGAGGVPTTATITLVQALLSEGSETTAGTDTGALLVVSNPTQSTEDTFSFAKLSNTGGVSSWPDGWSGHWGTAQVGDVADRSSSPVLRIGKRTATSHADDCCFMGLMVEYQ